jgi:hypothetical protein
MDVYVVGIDELINFVHRLTGHHDEYHHHLGVIVFAWNCERSVTCFE